MTGAPPSGHRKLAAHAGITFAGLTFANVLAYAFYALVSRAIGVEPYGTFAALVSVVLILSTPALIAQMVIAKLASDLVLEPERLPGLVRAVDRVTLGAAAAGGVGLIALSVPLAAFLRIGDPLLVTLAGCALAGAIVLLVLRGVVQGTSQFGAYALSNVVETGAKAMLAPALGFVLGVRGALAGTAVGYAVGAAYTFFAATPHRRGTSAPFPLRAVARTSAVVGLAVFCVNFLALYDGVLAKRYLDAHTTGLYGAASVAGRALYSMIAFVPVVLLPQAAVRNARREGTRWLLLQAFGIAAAIVAAVVAFFAFFGQPAIVVLTSPAFRGAAPFLVPYVYAVGMLALTNVVVTYNIARGRMAFVAPLALVALGEVASIVMRHRSAGDFLQTLVVGHTLALFAGATSLGVSRRRAPADERKLSNP